MPTGRRARRYSDVRDKDTVPIGDSGPRKRARWVIWSPSKAALVLALAVGVVLTLTPANGAASDIANGFVRAVRHLAAPSSRDGQAFTGTPPVGALFTTSAGQLGQHFCTASVVDSPAGDLVITAAHCVSGGPGHRRLRARVRPRQHAIRHLDGDQGLRRPGVEFLVQPG